MSSLRDSGLIIDSPGAYAPGFLMPPLRGWGVAGLESWVVRAIGLTLAAKAARSFFGRYGTTESRALPKACTSPEFFRSL